MTGASRGIGRAIALELARQGAFVIINYNGSKEKQRRIKAETRRTADRQKSASAMWQTLMPAVLFIKEIVKTYGRIDILVNNAGITKDGLLMAMSEEDFCKVVDTNLKGTF